MAYEGQKARSEARRAMREAGTQDTQRSWSNYVGDKPIKRMVYQPAFGQGALSYTDSPRYSPNAQSPNSFQPPQGEPIKPVVQIQPYEGYADSPSSFGSKLGFGSYRPTMLANPQPLEQTNYMTGATGFGGLPIFPFAGYTGY